MNISGFIDINDFSLGLDLSSSQTTIDIRSLADCKNVELTPKRGLAKRGGVKKLFEEQIEDDSIIYSLYHYNSSYGDFLIAHCGDGIYINDSGSWTKLASLVSPNDFSYATLNNICYAVNGDENFKIVDNSIYSVGISAPTSAPTLTTASGSLSGRYAYVYAYKNSSLNIYSNPSPISSDITVSSQGVKISVVESLDPQVDKIVIYRTFNLPVGDEPVDFYFVAEISNTTTDYVDNTPDSSLGEQADFDNYKPYVAKYVTEYQNRIFYANIPEETDGESLVVYSKIGNGDAIPAENYEYFGRGDGEEITGIASLPEYLVVFKKSRMFIIRGDFELKRLETSDYRIGCIDNKSIIRIENQVIFLSENGWYSFNGEQLYPISRSISEKLIEDGYIGNTTVYGTFYPKKNQIRFLIRGSGIETREYVGTFMLPTINYFQPMPITEVAGFVSWTKNIYDYHNLTCIARYVKDGVVRVIAGDNDGYVYLLDEDTTDEYNPIAILIQSGWFNFRKPENMSFLLRHFRINYYTGGDDTIKIKFNVDFKTDDYYYSLITISSVYCGDVYCGETYCGGGSNIIDQHPTTAALTGTFFRYTLEGDLLSEFTLNSLTLYYRGKGIRPM